MISCLRPGGNLRFLCRPGAWEAKKVPEIDNGKNRRILKKTCPGISWSHAADNRGFVAVQKGCDPGISGVIIVFRMIGMCDEPVQTPNVGAGKPQANQNQTQVPESREEIREKINKQDINDQVESHHNRGTFNPFFFLVHGKPYACRIIPGVSSQACIRRDFL